MKKILLILTVFVACNTTEIPQKKHTIREQQYEHDNRNGNINWVPGRAAWDASYYRLVIITNRKNYLTWYSYDTDILEDGNLRVYIWKCSSNNFFISTIGKCFGYMNKDATKNQLIEKKIILNLEEFSCYYSNQITFSNKYMKRLTADECKIFLEKYPNTILLKNS